MAVSRAVQCTTLTWCAVLKIKPLRPTPWRSLVSGEAQYCLKFRTGVLSFFSPSTHMWIHPGPSRSTVLHCGLHFYIIDDKTQMGELARPCGGEPGLNLAMLWLWQTPPDVKGQEYSLFYRNPGQRTAKALQSSDKSPREMPTPWPPPHWTDQPHGHQLLLQSTKGKLYWSPRAKGFGQEATLWAEVVEGPYLTFFLGRRLLVWPHFFLRQLTARGCRRA